MEAYLKQLAFDNVTERRNWSGFVESPSRKMSRESGIQTLPDSSVDYTFEAEEEGMKEVEGAGSRMCNIRYALLVL